MAKDTQTRKAVNEIATNDDKKSSGRLPWCWLEKPKLHMITSAFESNGAGATARSIYLAFSEIASDRQADTFSVSQGEIAARAGVSVATVRRVLPTLKQLGFVAIERNSIGGVETQSTYTLVRGPLIGIDERAPAHGERAPAQETIRKRATEKESEESEESKERVPKASNLCAEIWEAYPRKTKKPDGIRAIHRALRKESAATLLEKTRAFAAAQKGGDLHFCPYPATWFNSEQWNDDPATWKQYGPRPRNGQHPQKPEADYEAERKRAAEKRERREAEEAEEAAEAASRPKPTPTDYDVLALLREKPLMPEEWKAKATETFAITAEDFEACFERLRPRIARNRDGLCRP